MASKLEQLCKNEITEESVSEEIKKLKDNIAMRSIALTTLQLEQNKDKKDVAFLNNVLEDYSKSRKKNKRSQYTRKSIHTLEEVFSMIGQGRIVTPEGDTINTDSIRYQLFKEKGVVCVDCGLEGKFFAKEKDSKSREEIYHFNLYGIRDGQEVLFTRDHIKPQCKGGPDVMENLQTMCQACNCRKGSEWDGED